MTTPAASAATGRPLAYRLREFSQAAGIGRDAVYDAIRSGRLVARKVGACTLILHEDAERWLRSLPAVPTRPSAP